VSEIPLVGGDVNIGENTVVRVDDTVRRPQSDRADAVHALLLHFESVGFDGAPRFLGVDERGREVLSFVEGAPALAPAPGDDDVVADLGRLLRRMHDAQDGFALRNDVVARLNHIGYETHRTLGGIERRPGWAEMWDAGSGTEILARIAWFEAHHDDLLAFLR
jgi:hypothetical protein